MSFFFTIINAVFHFFELIGEYVRRAGLSVRGAVLKIPARFRIPRRTKKNYTPIKKHTPASHARHSTEPLQFVSSRYVKRRKRFRLAAFLFASLFVLAVSSGIAYGIYIGYVFFSTLPSPANIGKMNYSLTSHMYDRNGKLLYVFYHDQNRTPVKLSELKPYVYQASIAIEDKDFFKHKGVSLVGGIVRAFLVNVKSSDDTLQGGSTITQQLVKSALLTPEKTLERKLKEMILALWTERMYNKYQILEMYLNQVPYGGASYGVEEASKTYFSKDAKDLTLAEAALLAGLPQAPSIYSPYTNPDYAITRRNEVLKKMYEQGYINAADYKQALDQEMHITPPAVSIRDPHFVFYAKQKLEQQYGTKMVEEGGLTITSTIDSDLQDTVDQILREEIAKIQYLNVTNGAVLVTKPQTGEILAMSGSIDYYLKPYGSYNVTTGQRQPGSSIKPLVYALAVQNGTTATTPIADVPTTFTAPGSTEVYRPVNYDSRFHGTVTVRTALSNSYNIPAVKMIQSVGVAPFIDFARKLGISTFIDPSRYGLSLALGGGEVKMVDMATAFGVLANQGSRVDLTPVLKITDYQGEAVEELDPQPIPVVSSAVTFIISDIISDNAARVPAFGPRSALEIPGYRVAVKTGTTDNKKDNWTIGYTPEYLVAVWVGNNDNTPMNQQLTSGITGAAPIWNRVMTHILKSYSKQNTWYNIPSGIVSRSCGGRTEYYVAGTEGNARFCGVGTVNPTPAPAR